MYNKKKNVFVHHRDTGKIEVIRAGHLLKPKPAVGFAKSIHWIGWDRKVVCCCSEPMRHYEHTLSVSQASLHLNMALLIFLERHDYMSCTIDSYRDWRSRQNADWAKDGVHIESFHYVDVTKSVVCRCSIRTPKHVFAAPRNREIIEQCAEFFRHNKNELLVTSSQWKAMSGDAPPSYSARSDAFNFDSASMKDLLSKQSSSRVQPSAYPKLDPQENAVNVSSQNESPVPSDIPEQVWKQGRPSRHVNYNGMSSLASTPLGTDFPNDTLSDCRGARESSRRLYRALPPIPPASGTNSRPSSMDSIERDPSRYSIASVQEIQSTDRRPSQKETSPIGNGDGYPAELCSDSLYTKPLPTAAGLAVQELEGRVGPRPLSQRLHPIAAPEPSTEASDLRLSKLFDQVYDIVRLPTQEDFLLHHAVRVSRSNPPPPGPCKGCKSPYDYDSRRVIVLPICHHVMHEECLLSHLRKHDQELGKCPICDTSLCERTLIDRIDADRLAVYDLAFDRLRAEVKIDFPQRGEAVTCLSEEEVAVSKLRLVKDYIDMHAEELFRVWECNRAEPDWFNAVICPSAQLYQAWNQPLIACKLFEDGENFVKVLAWAELVRLMNVTRTIMASSQGPGMAYPSLTHLYDKFRYAVQRYEEEKKAAGEEKESDKMVQDVIQLALATC